MAVLIAVLSTLLLVGALVAVTVSVTLLNVKGRRRD